MSNVAETYFQAAIESTAGTGLAATRKLYPKADIPVEERLTEYIQQSRQSYIANHEAVETHVIANWKTEEVMNFEETIWYGLLAWKGGVTASGVGPYTWTYNGAATSDDLDTATIEAADNVAAVEMNYGMIKSWEITGADGNGPKPVMFKADWLGSKVVDTTMTAAISDRDIKGSYMLFKNTQVYLDATAGGIGTTEISNALMSFSLKCDNKIQPDYPGGNSGIFTGHSRDRRFVEITIELLLDATTYTQFTSIYKNGTARFLQLKNTGASNDLWTFNAHVRRWHKAEWKQSGPSRRIVLMAQSVEDPTLGYDWQTVFTNDISALT